MIEIDKYLNDGANYQCQMVLCYLRMKENGLAEMCFFGNGDDFMFSKSHIVVGRFENCREQGYVFGVRARDINELEDKWMVVEHRNADSIKVRHFRSICLNTPSIDACYDDKRLVEEKWFKCEDIITASEYIYNGMVKAINKWKEGKLFTHLEKKYQEKLEK